MRRADTTTLSFLITGDSGGSFHVVLPPDGPAVLRDGTAGGRWCMAPAMIAC